MDVNIIMIIVMLLFSAFFSGMEIAYVSSNKIHIEIEKKQGDFLARILTKLTDKPSKFIATMLIGNNIALVIYGFVMGDVLVSLFESMLPSSYSIVNYLLINFSLLTQTIISTIVILVTAEFLPKVFFQIYANSFLKIFAFPAYVFYVMFWFLSSFIIWMSDLILKRLFKTEGDDVQLAMSKVELGNYITEQMESVEEDDEVDSEIQIFQNALEFAEVKAREVMVPRTEITAVEVKNGIQDISTMFIDSGLSKILVYKENIDDILGYVHSFDLFKRPKSIKPIIKSVEYIPATMLVKDVLDLLTKKRKSMAVVIDEYGGTAGILTIEDIVEELVGEIEDEHDSVELIEEKISDTSYRFSGRLEVDYINEAYKLDLPEDEAYGTIGGLIVNETEGIPQEKDEVIIGEFKFTIVEVSSTKIDVVSLQIIEED